MFPSPGKEDVTAQEMPNRTNSPNSRMLANIPIVGDDSQSNRIQLAVNRYNSSLMSTVKVIQRRIENSSPHNSLLKFSPKWKNKLDLEQSCNRNPEVKELYPGVGNFPTVRLNKASYLWKPVKRRSVRNECRIQMPDLPTTRLLSDHPGENLMLKSTRSVLDVLQDLSRKRIHLKDDLDDSNKRICKGLGGEGMLDMEAPYKPLFVAKKTKFFKNTTDKTTQTGDRATPVDDIKDNIVLSEVEEKRRELRRQLARKNNELLASMSSVIGSSFCAFKRKIDNVLTSKPNGTQDEVAQKRLKTKSIEVVTLDEEKETVKNDSEMHKDGNSSNTENSPPKKQKTPDVKSKSPQNQDRMMTIYLHMQDAKTAKEQLLKTTSSNDVTDTPKESTNNTRELETNSKMSSEKEPVLWKMSEAHTDSNIKESTLGVGVMQSASPPTFPMFNFKPTNTENKLDNSQVFPSVPPKEPVQFLTSNANTVTGVDANNKSKTTFPFLLPPAEKTDIKSFALSEAKPLTNSSPFQTTTPFQLTTSTVNVTSPTFSFGSSSTVSQASSNNTVDSVPKNSLTSTPTTSFGVPLSTSTTSTFVSPMLTPTSSTFGVPKSTPTTSTFSSLVSTSISSTFGSPVSTPISSAFGVPVSTSISSTFGVPVSTPISSTFGVPVSTPTSSTFGVPVSTPISSTFGVPVSTPISSTFGVPTTAATETPKAQFLFGSSSVSSLGKTDPLLPTATTTANQITSSTLGTTSGLTTSVSLPSDKPTFAFGSTPSSTPNTTSLTNNTSMFAAGVMNTPSSLMSTEKPNFTLPAAASTTAPSDKPLFGFGVPATSSSVAATVNGTVQTTVSVSSSNNTFIFGSGTPSMLNGTNTSDTKPFGNTFPPTTTSNDKPQFTFGSGNTVSDKPLFGATNNFTAVSTTNTSDKPVFVFGTTPMQNSFAPTNTTIANNKPAFSFTSTSSTSTVPNKPFVFGESNTSADKTNMVSSSGSPAVTTNTVIKPAFVFGASSTAPLGAPSTTNTPSTFLFGGSNPIVTSAPAPTTSLFSQENKPVFTFDSNKTSLSSVSSTPDKKPTFPFGSNIQTTPMATSNATSADPVKFQFKPQTSNVGQPNQIAPPQSNFNFNSNNQFGSGNFSSMNKATPTSLGGQSTPAFGQFTGTQPSISFGLNQTQPAVAMPTSSIPAFGATAATTTTAPSFNFNNNPTPTPGFGFGNTATQPPGGFNFGTTNTTLQNSFNFNQSQPQFPPTNNPPAFQFGTQPKEPFTFGAGPPKEGEFKFSFGSTQMTPQTADSGKSFTPVFSFGSSPTQNSTPSFSTGTPSTFNFGSSSGGSSSSVFSFGSNNNTQFATGGMFGQGLTPSLSTQNVPGTFSMGSGSTQPRARSSARVRRRP